MADADVASEPAFRANKRRKVFRKRAGSDLDEGAAATSRNTVKVEEDGRADEGEEDGSHGVARLQKRPTARKHGIAFSSGANSRRNEQQPANEETALVSISQDAVDEVQNDRFVKPTGKEVVTEDRHMMAYIDSKLAEMRSTAASPANTSDANIASNVAPASAMGEEAMTAQVGKADGRTFQPAQAPSDRIYERPSTRRARKKKPYQRDEADIARDAYIEQFMQEAQVPIYDRSGSSNNKNAGDDAEGDNDAATAEAFKAQLLADMENHRRRPPKSASAQAANVTSGPKLGGSRQQRERHRAAQEAEAKK